MKVKHKAVSKLTDTEIVDQIVNTGNIEPIEILYSRYAERVYKAAIAIVKDRDAAQDITHDIFLRVYSYLHTYNNKSKFSTWLFCITRNYCIDYIRKNKNRKLISMGFEEGIYNDVMSVVLEDESKADPEKKLKQLEAVFSSVRKEEVDILIMKYKDGLSIKQIKDKLDISESATKMRIKRAKEKVREIYLENITSPRIAQ